LLDTFNYVGPQVEALFGYPRDDWFRERFWEEHLHPDVRERTVESHRRAITDGDHLQLEYRMLSANGGTVWLHETSQFDEH
jgi:PAS domain S-box-containing protein